MDRKEQTYVVKWWSLQEEQRALVNNLNRRAYGVLRRKIYS